MNKRGDEDPYQGIGCVIVFLIIFALAVCAGIGLNAFLSGFGVTIVDRAAETAR